MPPSCLFTDCSALNNTGPIMFLCMYEYSTINPIIVYNEYALEMIFIIEKKKKNSPPGHSWGLASGDLLE